MSQEKLLPTTGYAVAFRCGKGFRLHPRTFSLRKDLVAAYPHVMHNPRYRIVRVDITARKAPK